MGAAIVWFRRDLRLADHAALNAALAYSERVVPLYVHAPDEEAPWAPGAASRWWLHHSLAALEAALAARGATLVLRSGPSLDALLEVAAASGATRIYWNRGYEPAVVARDTRLKAALREHGLGAESLPGNLLFEPWTVQSGAGEPYRVFTPFCAPASRGSAPWPRRRRCPPRFRPRPARQPRCHSLRSGCCRGCAGTVDSLRRGRRAKPAPLHDSLLSRLRGSPATPTTATGPTSPAARDSRRTCTSARSRRAGSSQGSGRRARPIPATGSRPVPRRSSAS